MSTLTDYTKDFFAWDRIHHRSFLVPEDAESAVSAQLAEWFTDAFIRDAWGKQASALSSSTVDDMVFCTGDELTAARAVAHKAIREWFIDDEQNRYAAWMYLSRKADRDAAEHRAEAA